MIWPAAKACGACRGAKRKCSRHAPTCQRCETRGLTCEYPPDTSWRLYGYGLHDETPQATSSSSTAEDTALGEPQHELTATPLRSSSPSVDSLSEQIHAGCEHAARLQACLPSISDLQSAWFLTPEAWQVSELDRSRLTPISSIILKRYIAKIQDWFKEWVNCASNPFIHALLFKSRFPAHVQDAFLALSAYHSRTSATEDMVHRIMEERSEQLIDSQTRQYGQARHMDLFDHMTRVQCLLAYSVVRLFDGDIRQRNFAEKQIPTLRAWNCQMLRRAGEAATSGSLLVSNLLHGAEYPAMPERGYTLQQDSQEKILWHAWVVSESIRRTWIVCETILAIYEVLRNGSTDCPGGMMVTTRRGAWEAVTAFEWTKTCAEQTVGFMGRNETERVLFECDPADIDRFSLALIELDYGLEKMQRWGVEVHND